jgi:outer membrane protein
MNKRMLLLFCLSMILAEILPAQNLLDNYIQLALTSNLSLKEKEFDLQKSQNALQIARTYFMPSVTFETQYTLAKGGRTINIPIGDLVNPVYRTLNQLTNSNQFPTIENVEEQFLPNNFYDVRVRTSLPILQPDLKLNVSIKEKESEIAKTQIELFKKDLILEVKQAYFQILQRYEAIQIYHNAIQLVQKQLQITQSLITNGVALPFSAKRMETELINLQSQLQNVEHQAETAQFYLNFLLNQPLQNEINTEILEEPAPILPNFSVQNKEELYLLNQSSAIYTEVFNRKKAFATPQISWFLDLAAQGFDFEINRNSFFYLTGLQLQMPIYQFNRNRRQIDQAQLDLNQSQVKWQSVSKGLELNFSKANNDYQSAYAQFQTSKAQIETAHQYYLLTSKAFSEGVASYIEYLDALNQYTNAQIQSNILKYATWIALAKLERQQ